MGEHEKADHAAQARQHIDWVHEWQSEEGATEATHLATALVAQAEATLALAEQQRIANLIAFLATRPDNHTQGRLQTEIRKGLGL
ncbi:hypothetical protein [Microbacterium stercoris]|uniref:Uncharacterized protein n=1 Tax=Microbacterium stercoris TaxID=2820289 RepID=A0A939QSA1_9MICO|nr:hypothetical protein [Microbacterium stercoris]MBO3663701.1 hypothetical protein [Microbacterium stercoris]